MNFKNFFIMLLLLTFFSNIKATRYEVYTQTAFDNLMDSIANNPARSSITDLYIDSYDGGVYSSDYLQDMSKISILKDLTSLKTLTIQIGHSLYGQLGFDQTMDAIKDITTITNMYIFFYGAQSTAAKLTNIDKLDDVLKTKLDLHRLYLHFGYNQITDFTVGLQSLPLLTKLSTELRLIFYGNKQTSVTGFKDLFHNLTSLKLFTLNLNYNEITDTSDLEDSFHKMQELTSFSLEFINNNIQTFTLHNCVSTQTKLTSIYIYYGPRKETPSNYPDFYIVNDNVTYYQMLIRKGAHDFNNKQLLAHLPKMNTLKIYSNGEGYDYDTLKYIVDCLEFAPSFQNLYFEFVSMPVSDGFVFTDWYNLLDKIRTRVRYIYFYDHACYSDEVGNHLHWTQILQGTTNLYRLYLRSYHYRNNKTYGQIDHPTLTTFTFVIYSTGKDQWKFTDLAPIYDGFPNLTTVHLEFSYCKLTDADLYDLHYAYKGLTGRTLTNTFYFHLGGNQISSLNFLQSPYPQQIKVNSNFYLNVNVNKIENYNGFKQNLESFLHQDSQRFILYSTTNKITDATGLSNAFLNYKMITLHIDIRTNQIPEYEQFIGMLENQQPSLDNFQLYTHNNLITNQVPLNDVLLPVTYYKKQHVNTYYFSFIDPELGDNTGHGSLRSSGKYPAIAENGVCWSTYSQAQYYFETLDPNDNTKVVKNCGNCHSQLCHSCTETTVGQSKCEKCRYSEPARVLNDDCNCPVGYYDGPSNYTCLQCMYLCVSCDNGNDCITCKASTPARTTKDCICPDKYYDDGTNIQCQNCITGCLKCDNGSTCQTCEDGYFLNSSNTCVRCPNKFKKCTSATVGTECQGLKRSSVTPDCKCTSGYYDDNQNADCNACVNNCTTCTSDSVCQSCLSGYYLDIVTCKICPLKFKTCSSSTQGTLCQGNNRSSVTPDCKCLDGYFDKTGTNLKDCAQCTSPCKTCEDSATKCLSCIDGYYLNGNTCVKCPNKFKTCSSQTIGKICQGQNRSSVTPSCNCNNGYFDDGTNQADCTQCTNNCATCNSSTHCNTCVSSYYLDSNTCKKCPNKYAECATPTDGLQCQGQNRSSVKPQCECNSGYYDDGTNQADCTQCTNNCATCTSSTICQSCVDGYYLDGTTCKKCLLKYETCSDLNQGTKCQGQNRSTETPDCVCDNGFYNDVTKIDCQNCVSPCKFCDSTSLCTSCVDGYYLDGTSCLQCNYKFAKCTDINTATECKGTNRTTDTANDCPCQNGYYDDLSNSDCVVCVSPCKYCTSNSQCSSCIVGYYLDGTSCVQCPARFKTCTSEFVGTECQGNNRTSNKPNCECKDTYYDDGVNADCVKCQYPCLNCTKDKCTSCTDNVFRNQDDECSCFEGYYDHTISQQCSLCHYKCDLCSSSHDVCDTCSDTNNRDLSQNCICKPTYFDIDQQELCEKCIHPCDTCTDFDVCLSCSITDDVNRNSTPSCTCKDGYYDDPDTHECLKCLNKCTKCSDAFTCLECNTSVGNNRNFDINDNCGCEDGYYDDNQNNLQCQPCQYPCQHCTSATTCIIGKCSTLDNRDLQTDKCGCLPGYYDSGNVCSSCHHKCVECIGKANQCIGGQCSDDTRENYPSCTCKDGLQDIGKKQCGRCAPKCLECNRGLNNCTKCVVAVGRLQIQDGCACKEGYYDDGLNSDCQQCYHLCRTCKDGNSCETCLNENSDKDKLCEPIKNDEPQYASFSVVNPVTNQEEEQSCSIKCESCQGSADTCLTCKVGINRLTIAPECACQEGYHDINGIKADCYEKCEPQCKTCNTYYTCTSCRESEKWVLNQQTQMCECINGYKEQIISNLERICVQCDFYFQNKCVEKCPDSTILDKESKTCVEIEYIRKNNMLLLIGGGVFLVLIQIALFFVLRYSFKNFISKKIPYFQQLEREEALADIESENRLKESSSSSDKDTKKERNIFNDDDTISIPNSNQEDYKTIQRNKVNKEENSKKRISHLQNYRQKRGTVDQNQLQNNVKNIKRARNSRNRFINNE